MWRNVWFSITGDNESNRNAQHFEKGFSHLERVKIPLNKLISYFAGSFREITDTEVKGINWKAVTSIESLNLDLSGCESVNDSTLFDICNALETFPSIQEIHLNFSGYFLKYYKFLLKRCDQITNSGLWAIVQTLGKLVSLKDLRLILS